MRNCYRYTRPYMVELSCGIQCTFDMYNWVACTHLSPVTFLDLISSTYGYLTWEWQKAIRGYTHPLVFAILYKLLSCLHLDWPSLLVLLPRVVVQAPLAAAADYHVFKLASLLYGSNVGWYAVSFSSFSLLSSSSHSPFFILFILLLPLFCVVLFLYLLSPSFLLPLFIILSQIHYRCSIALQKQCAQQPWLFFSYSAT